MKFAGEKEYVFTVRPTNNCHASTLLKVNGGLLCAWFGGSREGNNDVDIWLSERKDSGWTAPRIVSGDRMITNWNPVLFAPEKGTVALYYKSGLTIQDWITKVCFSYDNGVTFTPPTELVAGDRSGGRGPVKNKPMRLSDGRILAPASVERGQWKAFIDISDDNGITWRKTDLITAQGLDVIQPTLWQDKAGDIHMLLRSRQGFIYRSDSSDRGETWSTPRPTDIVHNNSGIDLVRLSDGRLILACNPIKDGRQELALFVSEDNGESFIRTFTLEKEENGEFSYPSVISDGNEVYVSYTYNRTHIAFRKFEF